MRSSIRQFSENVIGGSSLRFTLTCRQSSRSNLSRIYPVCTLSLWTRPLTRFASLRKGSARKSTSPRTRGEVAQAARVLPPPSSEPYAMPSPERGEPAPDVIRVARAARRVGSRIAPITPRYRIPFARRKNLRPPSYGRGATSSLRLQRVQDSPARCEPSHTAAVAVRAPTACITPRRNRHDELTPPLPAWLGESTRVPPRAGSRGLAARRRA